VNAQRTLLPYRLRVQAAEVAILEEVSWLDDTSFVQTQIELVISRRSVTAIGKLRGALYGCMREDLADVLLDDLVDAADVVALFEREWQFPHGFALVPLRREALPGGAA
jgi:hypothetical protein